MTPDPSKTYVVDLRCPTCGPVEAAVDRWGREGVELLTCTRCGARLEVYDSLPLSRMREAVVPERFSGRMSYVEDDVPGGPGQEAFEGENDDDGA